MTNEEAIAKAVKLLRLATSSNPNEAALAAAKAQEIITRHNIESSALAMAQNSTAPDEPIQDFGNDPLDAGVRKVATWTWRLFLVIGKQNGCKGYLSRLGGIAVVGRPSDVQTVRYLYSWLRKEVDQLTGTHCKGYGRTWANNFRNGVVDTIAEKMKEQHKQTEAAAREQAKLTAPQTEAAQQFALMCVNNALAKLERREQETADWMKENLQLRSGSRSSYRSDSGARQAGRNAGQSIRFGSRGSVGAGARGLIQ